MAFIQSNDHEDVVALKDRIDKVVFVGTQAEWNVLSIEEKAKYSLVNITDA